MTTLKQITVDGIEFELQELWQQRFPKASKKYYQVERGDHEEDLRNRYWFTSKVEATKYFKSLESKAVVVKTSGVHALNRLYGA